MASGDLYFLPLSLMAEFQIFLPSFLPSVLIIEGVSGMGGGVEWGGTGRGGSWQKPPLGTTMSSHDAHTVTNNISGPHSQRRLAIIKNNR